MASIFTKRLGGVRELQEEWKQTGTQNGDPVYAKVVALEPTSIGGGGGGVASSVSLADGTTPSQLAAVSAAGEVSTDVADRAARLLGHVTVDNSTLAVTQSGSWTSDVTDRVGRLLGHVTVDNASLAVTGTFFQATQPVSLATNTPDVTDRAARLLGHVTVDNASLAVTGPLTDTQLRASAVPVSGTFFQGTQPVSGPLTDAQLRASAVPVDVSDRVARLVGHVSVDSLAGDVAVINSATVGKTKLAVTPDPTDITDRVGRLLGHVTVDNASLAVTGPLTDAQLRATPVPISGTITANGDVDHDAVNTLKVIQTGGHASNDSPTAVAVGDRARHWVGIHGEQKAALVRPWTNVGDFRAVTLALAHAAAADAATAGRWWLINPVGSGIAIAVLRVYFYHAFTAAAAQLTIPRITLERVTFTGTASGASLTPSKRVRTTTQGQTADATPVGSVRTASTGLTLTAGEIEHAALPPTALTAVGAVANSLSMYGVSERGEDALILAPGEGLVCRQADASATGRSWLNTIDWSEFTN